MNERQFRDNLSILFVRYREIGKSIDSDVDAKYNITGLATMALSEINTLSLFKLNRWLGYLQGTLISLGLLTIEDERNFTRPYLSPFDVK